MKLTLKDDFTYYIINSRNSVTDTQRGVIASIRDLEKLYDLSNLSDEELKELLAKYYNWVPYLSSNRDIEAISRSVIKCKNVSNSIVATSIIKVYYDQDSDFDINHTYTFSELQKLINARKIVVECLLWSDRRAPEAEAAHANLNEELFLPAIDKITLKCFWGYEDIMLPSIKRRLQKDKVYRDIMRIINSMRFKLQSENKQLLDRREELYAALSKNAADIDIRSNYIRELSGLEEYRSEEAPRRA